MRGLFVAQLLVVLATAILLLAGSSQARRIDCTKFVFAPRCRGVAAKRADLGLPPTRPLSQDDFLDKTERRTPFSSRSGSPSRILSNLQNLIRKLRMADSSSFASDDSSYYVDDAELRP